MDTLSSKINLYFIIWKHKTFETLILTLRKMC